MLLNIKKLKISPYKSVTVFLIIFFICFFIIKKSMTEVYSKQGDNLLHELNTALIKQGICDDTSTCNTMLDLSRKDGKRIHLHMYGQTNMFLTSKVAAFLVKNGIKITEGKPITLNVFIKPKTAYSGLKYAFGNNEAIIQLEINKE